jgi:hypothetical protein
MNEPTIGRKEGARPPFERNGSFNFSSKERSER